MILQHLALAAQAFIEEIRPLGRDDLGHLNEFRILLQRVERLPQILEQEIVQAFRSAAARLREDTGERRRILDRGIAADFFRNIELARKITIDIARRHLAVFRKLGHGCLRVAVMLETAAGGFDDFCSGIVAICHLNDYKQDH